MSLEALEEAVIFSEWRALRHTSSRSLHRTAQLMRQLGYHPDQQEHVTLGIVGSKGKGTASAYASAALAGLGHRVGTVMSPGVLSNADRIRIDGAVVDEQVRRRVLLQIQEAKDQLPTPTAETGYLAPTGLFLLTGFLLFAEAGVGAVVAEAGIGGASDDLSHWPLEVVAVTRIFGEHLDILGPSVTDVARDKSAVITSGTQLVVSYPQRPEVAEIIERRCAQMSSRLILAGHDGAHPGDLCARLTAHLPKGFPRLNAALGVTAALGIPAPIAPGDSNAQAPVASPIRRLPCNSGQKWRIRGVEGGESTLSSHVFARLAGVVQSVQYPGRMSVHEVADSSRPRCVVDSAVSRDGLRAALEFAGTAVDSLEQVLVCLSPGKDLAGFIAGLEQFAGQKVFVEMPGAYIGTPERSAWPVGPGWEWITLADLGEQGVHQAPGSAQLLELLARGESLAVGTVLFTSLVLRTLGTSAKRLFTPPG
ncbi:hypothetical protein [Nesterenkonia muleiensis]|uniref:hypothetical protein n=1 Tax=Nesterenkonia muleiensis TaxID=2282648 RepID=UPI000E74D6DA|nr:hypothetical protein [Nesterenkonia muleiensis]